MVIFMHCDEAVEIAVNGLSLADFRAVRWYAVNSITMVTVIILSHKSQNPLTASDHHIMIPIITTQVHKFYHTGL
jgi:hypothetical protein